MLIKSNSKDSDSIISMFITTSVRNIGSTYTNGPKFTLIALVAFPHYINCMSFNQYNFEYIYHRQRTDISANLLCPISH